MSDIVLIAAGLIFALAVLAFIVFVLRQRGTPIDPVAEQRMAELSRHVTELAGALDMERKMNSERIANMKETFASLAAEALQRNNEGFLNLADESFKRHREGAITDLDKRETAIEGLVKPVKESLDKFELK